MNLKRQLLLVSLLTLVLPWAGCEFIRETETALREGQQQMLAGTAQAIADALAQFPDEFHAGRDRDAALEGQLYAHPLEREPALDGYFQDWPLERDSFGILRGPDGPVSFVLGTIRQQLWLYVEVRDGDVQYAAPGNDLRIDKLVLATTRADGTRETFEFRAEAPGSLLARRADGSVESRAAAHWQDVPGGWQLEARVPRALLGPDLGLTVHNAAASRPTVRSSTFTGAPGLLVTPSLFLQSVLRNYVQPGLRLVVTDTHGWQLAIAGDIRGSRLRQPAATSGWLRLAYDAILAPGAEAELAEPDPSGRERQAYVQSALGGEPSSSWFRAAQTGRAVVAVAQPVYSGTVQTGAVILQQGTDAILSLTSEALTRLIGFTLIATLVAAGVLIGYATWLSQRVRRLSRGARRAPGDRRAHAALPSLTARDEIGDLSRSFASVLEQLGDYNEYLRTLASKLSHELRTPLTIVRSSLDNLEHESLSEEARTYTGRARDGVERLKRILNAMSEASRVEELIESAEFERVDLARVLETTIEAYADAWPQRRFRYESELNAAELTGAPDLLIQMLDKLVDNAVDFSRDGDEIIVALTRSEEAYRLSVENPGPPLPEKMRDRLFDSMISVRGEAGSAHLGLGLFVARLIAEGHGGDIRADNTGSGVRFTVSLALD